MAAVKSVVDLGFAEKFVNTVVSSPFLYPSKIGGKPAWLSFQKLPKLPNLACGVCGIPTIFLCQIYTPVSKEQKQFHRTVFVFCCKNGTCSKSNNFLKVFRCIKAETVDDFDSSTPDAMVTQKTEDFMKFQTLCELCGIFGDKLCSRCSQRRYCSKLHQTIDWKSHKKQCNNENHESSAHEQTKYLFDEYEIVTETEPEEDTEASKKETEKYQKYLENSDSSDQLLSNKELLKIKETKSDNVFNEFHKRVQREPDQVIRYELGGEPLWVSEENRPTLANISNCSCGAKRQFELQILPQMLNYLGVETTIDSIDWGTLCIYTCSVNCKEDEYVEEFVWKQDFSQVDIS